ncbi:MAG: hypothetical protein U5K84_03035 [Alkalibacterium sp.]|nr:hypothetical protein [Alkalibacterium sp.]
MNVDEGKTLQLIAILSTTFLISLEQYFLSKMNEDKRFNRMISAALVLAAFLLGLLWFLSQ